MMRVKGGGSEWGVGEGGGKMDMGGVCCCTNYGTRYPARWENFAK